MPIYENNLKKIRKQANITQEELAKVIGVNVKTIARWENQETRIKEDKVYQLSDFLGVEVGYLLGFQNDKQLRNQIAHNIAQTSDDPFYTYSLEGNWASDFLKQYHYENKKDELIIFIRENIHKLSNDDLELLRSLLERLLRGVSEHSLTD